MFNVPLVVAFSVPTIRMIYWIISNFRKWKNAHTKWLWRFLIPEYKLSILSMQVIHWFAHTRVQRFPIRLNSRLFCRKFEHLFISQPWPFVYEQNGLSKKQIDYDLEFLITEAWEAVKERQTINQNVSKNQYLLGENYAVTSDLEINKGGHRSDYQFVFEIPA